MKTPAVETYTVKQIARDALGGWKYQIVQGEMRYVYNVIARSHDLQALLHIHDPYFGFSVVRDSDGAMLAPDSRSWIPSADFQTHSV